jgi:hypothetical protein
LLDDEVDLDELGPLQVATNRVADLVDGMAPVLTVDRGIAPLLHDLEYSLPAVGLGRPPAHLNRSTATRGAAAIFSTIAAASFATSCSLSVYCEPKMSPSSA